MAAVTSCGNALLYRSNRHWIVINIIGYELLVDNFW